MRPEVEVLTKVPPSNQGTTKHVVDLIHGTVQRVRSVGSIVTFLKFALKPVEDMIESKTAFARGTHASAHPDEPLRLHCRTTLTDDGEPLTFEVECITGTSGGRHVLMVV